MSEAEIASLVVSYAVVQTVVLLLLVRALDPYEREPLSLLGVLVVWGAIGATGLSALGNAAFSRALSATTNLVFGPAIYSPLVEEGAKGLALVAFLVVSVMAAGRFGIPRFEGVTDGIVYGAAVGLGFAFTEDILYLLNAASQNGLSQGLSTYLARRGFLGVTVFHHAIYSAAFGVGLGLATWTTSRLLRVLAPALGLALAILLHAANNGLVQLVLVLRYGFDRTAGYLEGITLPGDARLQSSAGAAASAVNYLHYATLVAFIVGVQLWLAYQRNVIRSELEGEIRTGLISREEWSLLPSYWRRNRWYWQLIQTGQWERWRLLRRIHNELVEFAFMKRRLDGGAARDDALAETRELIEKLKAQKLVFL
ncbi:MAG: PrsW family intramembrane metalloprotease [Actinomycetota bacterium]